MGVLRGALLRGAPPNKKLPMYLIGYYSGKFRQNAGRIWAKIRASPLFIIFLLVIVFLMYPYPNTGIYNFGCMGGGGDGARFLPLPPPPPPTQQGWWEFGQGFTIRAKNEHIPYAYRWSFVYTKHPLSRAFLRKWEHTWSPFQFEYPFTEKMETCMCLPFCIQGGGEGFIHLVNIELTIINIILK